MTAVARCLLARLSLPRCLPGLRQAASLSGSACVSGWRPERAVILTKVSRFEYEKLRHSSLAEPGQLERELRRRGSNYELVKAHHGVHKAVEAEVERALNRAGVETRLVKRFEYNDEAVDWADMVVTTGGDGTFLMGSSKVLDRNKPVIGFNTDPTRSEGHLCLPRHFSHHVEEAVRLLMEGKFRWAFRKRLRVTLVGERESLWQGPVELHEQKLQYPEYRFMDLMGETEPGERHPLQPPAPEGEADPATRTLPVLALNEIYIGESLSSRVSYLEVKVDEEEPFKTRNSGLCIATGTGSTSWLFNINKLTHHAVECLLKATFEVTRFPLNWKDPELVESVARKFNTHLVFEPDSPFMCYSLRDHVSQGTFPHPREHKPRGKARKISVQSKCFDACLVIDGSLSYKFNDGTKASIEMHEEDDLRTLELIRGV